MLRLVTDLAQFFARRRRAVAVLALVPMALAISAAQPGRGTAATPDQVGQWSAPITWPNVAVHVMLEPNGTVLSIDAWDDAPNKEYVWNPPTGTFTLAAYARNLFCAGHTQLGNGKTLIVGGNASANNGLKDTTIFDSTNNSWTRGPDMAVERWYPTATELPDGRVFVFSGDNIDASGPVVPHAFKSSAVNSLPEVYDPATNSWQQLSNARLTTPLYPFMFTLTDGRLVNVGPDTVTRTITPGQWTWQTVATSSFDGGSAVMYRPDKILKTGNYVDPDFTGADTFTTGAEAAVLDMSQQTPTWRNVAPMAFGRGYHVLTSLPDGKVLVTGGESRSDGRDLTKAVLAAEMWDPDSEQWTTMAAETNGRLYHSSALLLPDGRVLVAGGGQAPGGGSTNQLNAEIYSPPYLFKGTRPTITSAPSTFNWSGSFTVGTPNAASIASVSLIKTGAMTHAINMSQRFIPLTFTKNANSLTVNAPANSKVAPPGYYMLWIVDSNGVPSVSAMMTTSGTTETDVTAPSTPTGVTATGGAGFANLSWTAATDNVGVVRYNVHRSTTSGFTPSAANRIAQPTGTTYNDTTLAAGTYFYKVTAEDAAGNLSPASTQVTATVTADTTAPTVSITSPTGGTVSSTINVNANAGDNVAVAGVQFKLDGSPLGAEDTSGPYSISWDTTNATNGAHSLTAVARDTAGNTTTSTAVNVTVTNAGGTSGLVAAYGFDEGIGTTTADQSGTGNTGTLSGATWNANGKFGKALSFNGSNNFVSVPDSAPLDLTNALTVEAWVNPSSLGSWNTVVFKERPGYYAYALYANTGTNRPSANAMVGSTDADTRGTAPVPANTWTHLAATYDGNMLTLYVNGNLASQLLAPGQIVTSTNPLKIGGNAIWGEFFSGLIDEVRIYNRTLTSAQIQADMTRPVTSLDSTAPSAPTGLAGTGSQTSAQLNWVASTDNVGVVRYNVHRDVTPGFTPTTGNRVAQPTGTSYTDNVAGGAYYYKVTAEDAAGNVSSPSNEISVQVGDTTPPSAPGTLTASGGVGQTSVNWGAATDNVGVVRYNLYRSTTSGFTPSAANRIAQPTATSYSEIGLAAGTYYYRVAAEDAAGNIGTASNEASAVVTGDTTAPGAPSGLAGTVTGSTINLTWTAATDNVGVARYNVHRGTTSGFTPSAANRIAQPTGTSYADTGLATGAYFYKVTAEDAAGNVGNASNEATATVADATPPSAPGTVTATVAGSTVNLSWGAATDNVGVVRYNVHRGTTSSFTPSAANRVGQPTTTSYGDNNVAPGAYFYKVTAEDAAGNVGAVSNTASATVADTTAPSTPGGLGATGAAGQASLTWTAATDNVGVVRYNVHRSTTSGFTPSAANRIAQPTATSYSDTGLGSGTYFYKVTAEDAAGNLSAASNEASATVAAAPPSGLVAAYGFDEGAGTTTADKSGNNNTGTLSNATWNATGKFGAALSFNGTNSLVNVANSSSLQLSTAMTLEAWVRPTTLASWNTVVFKERTGYYAYALYANTGSNRPSGNNFTTGDNDVRGTAAVAANTWTHLAVTYNGSVLALYVNGTQAATLIASGSIAANTGLLRIGGNTIWGEYYNGLIDEVRVYNRALSAAEITTDMNAPVTNPDSTPPSAPGTLTGTGGLTSAQLNWGAATDNVGVARYDVYRGTTAGFTPSAANRIAQPTGLSYTDTVAAGTYYYKVAAEDAVGNVGPTTNELSLQVGDTSAPSAPGTLTATGQIGRANLSWGAASDNVGVVRYNVHRGTTSGFTPSAANRIAQPTGTTYQDNTAAGTYFYKVTAEDAAGNVGNASNEATATVLTDTTAPGAPSGLSAGVTGSTANLTWSAATDDVAVVRYNVHRGTTAGFTPSAANRIAQPTGTSYSDTGLAIGTYYYKVTAEDAAGNVGGASNEVSASVADATAPSAPSGLAANVAGSTVNLTWTAATDNVGVVRYNVHRGTTSGFTPSAANRVGQPAGTSFADTGVAPGAYFYKVTAEDAAGNVGAVSNTASATVADTTAPGAPGGLGATGGAGQATLSWSAATDNVGVVRYNVHRATTSGFTPSAANRIAQPTGTSYTDNVAAGVYFYKVTAEDAAGNVGAASNEASATVSAPPVTGLVAAYGFDEGSGTTTSDGSGNGNTGTLSNATWNTGGKFGNALSFNGTNSIVNVANSAGLQLTNGMTLEAWVKPTSLGSWNTVLFKERSNYYAYALYANTGTNRPSANTFTNGDNDVRGTAAVATGVWTHLAATYNGTVLAIYVNGTQAATLLVSGGIVSNTGALRIGGNTIWGEYYNGLIDEVRVYNRALSAAEITTDMNKSVTAPDTTPPTTPGNFVKTGSTAGTVSTSWSASSDSVGVTDYRVYRNDVLQGTITGTTFTFVGMTCSTSSLFEVEARDFAGNVSPRAQLNASTDDCDTTPPSAPGTLTATGQIGRANLSWGAATDNVGVVRYNVHRGTTAGFTPTAANRIAQPTGTTYQDVTSPGTYFYKVTAEDSQANVGPVSNEASATVLADTTAPSQVTGLSATGGQRQVALSWTAATDNVGVARYNVHRSQTSGFTPSAANRVGQPTGTSFTDTNLAAGTYYYKVTSEDAAGNVGAASTEVNGVATNPPPVGLVAGYGFDAGTGTSAADSAGTNNGTLVGGAGWALGKFGNAVTLDGLNDMVTVPDSASLDLTSAMTLEAWVLPNTALDWRSVIFKTGSSDLVYGMYASTNANVPSGDAVTGGTQRTAKGGSSLTPGVWTHLAATYDGSNLRLFVNGTQAASTAATGNIQVSSGVLTIGGNNLFSEWFNGKIDEVRIYNRALSATEIQSDMNLGVANDTTAPTVTQSTPATGSPDQPVGLQPTAKFSEPIDQASLAAAWQMRDSANNLVPATVQYDEYTASATLVPSVALTYGASYTVTIKGGVGGLKDRAGNPLAADKVWTFTTEAVPPPILVIGSTTNKFTMYTTEILKAEGLNDFSTLDISLVSPAVLSYYDVAILGDTPLTSLQVQTLTNWVTAGGNLIALHPDKQLAGLLGITDTNTTLANAYLKVDTTTTPGNGIYGQTMQFHGTADRYTLSGATAIATLYSNSTTATSNPAVTLKPVGSSGGDAAAFTFDLARSIVYTRQGNPAFAGQDRDGVGDIRPNDLFYSTWLDTSKIGVPQADEQQRLLANLITRMNANKTPLPRFWYLPRDEKAAIVMTGDDHATGGTAGRFDQYIAASPAGCSVVNWDCIRSTSYIYTNTPLTNAQAASYTSQGFEVALHVSIDNSCKAWPQGGLDSQYYTPQLNAFLAKYTSIPAPVTERTHCVEWADWATQPKVELAHGIRLDTNYYHYPASWIGNTPGYMNGSGEIMRFADTDGSLIDVYQAMTHNTDESNMAQPASANFLMDNALGANAFYGMFTILIHTDIAANADSDAVIASAKSKSVPVISAKQALDWVDGRGRSTFRNFSWNGSTVTFSIAVGSGANGLRAMLPMSSNGKTLISISRGGTNVSFTTQTIKGISYAFFDAAAGGYSATYS